MLYHSRCSAEYHSDECHGATKYFKLIRSYSWGLYYTTFYSRKKFYSTGPWCQNIYTDDTRQKDSNQNSK
jgi:hypothetical protein